MPRFKFANFDQHKMLPVSFADQITPGTFEYSLSYLIDMELDTSVFHDRFKNDEQGRPAYDPAILLKIILLAYSRGITSSRKMAELCQTNVLFMAISADSQPHFTTLSNFISEKPEQIGQLFQQVLLVCDELKLIGGHLFAIDGCKLPSNASKEWSGTRADLRKKQKKLDQAVRKMLAKHREEDAAEDRGDSRLREREEQQIEKLQRASRKIKEHLATQPEKLGRRGKPVKGNITDPDSAKMKTSKGVIQGYVGVAAVDAKHQVIVQAEAYGQGQEHGLLEPTLEGIRRNLNRAGPRQATPGGDVLQTAKITADSGYHNAQALEYLHRENLDGYIADTGFRSRDPRFKEAKRHKPVSKKTRFSAEQFRYDPAIQTCRCPAGKLMWRKSADAKNGRYRFAMFQGYKHECESCPLRGQCLRNTKQQEARQVNIRLNASPEAGNQLIEAMKQKIDSRQGRYIYSQRLGTVEPVFAHLTDNIGIKRFNYRGRAKVNGQWQLMATLHNLLKIHRERLMKLS